MTHLPPRVEKWDVHTHTTLAPRTFEALGRFDGYAELVRVRAHAAQPCRAELVDSRGSVMRVIEANAYDGAARIAECDLHGVTRQVLSPTPMTVPDFAGDASDAETICRILNDGNAEMVAGWPARFTSLAVLPMRHTDAALRELERARRSGHRGVAVNSNIDGADLDEPCFFPIFEAIAECGLAVFVHPWGGLMQPREERLERRMARNWRPWLIGMALETALAFDSLRAGRVHERLPHLRVLYAHGGGAFPALLGRLEHGAYCRPDLFRDASPVDPYETVLRSGVYVDSLTHDPFALAMLVELLGASRIAMGSDYPYPLGEIDPIGRKGLVPGYTIENLPADAAGREEAWSAFPWLPRANADGPRSLPLLTREQKERLLAGTAKEWLAWS